MPARAWAGADAVHVLVVGQSGQLARSLALRAPEGWRVTRVGRDDIDLFDPEGAQHALADRIAGARPDAIVNAAAYTAVDAAEDDEAAAMLANAASPGRLARAAAEAAVPFLHISTDYVFSGESPLPHDERVSPAPATAYGRSKALGEAAVLAAGGRAMVVRTAWLFSPFGHNFVTTMLRLARERPTIRVVDDQTGNPTSAIDLADALFAIIGRWPGKGTPKILHFAGAGATSWCGLAQATMREAAAHGLPAAAIEPIPGSAYPTRARRPQNSQLATGVLESSFDIVPRPWTAMLGDTVARIAEAERLQAEQ